MKLVDMEVPMEQIFKQAVVDVLKKFARGQDI